MADHLPLLNTVLKPLFVTLIDLFRSWAMLYLENLALRQQLAMVSNRKRIQFRRRERLFWVLLYRCWPGCLKTLQVFQPDTLMSWHRKGFRFYCRWKSRQGRSGRPKIYTEVRELIRTMSRENISLGAPLPRATNTWRIENAGDGSFASHRSEIHDSHHGPHNKWSRPFPLTRHLAILLREQDSIYSELFRRRVKSLGIEEILTAPRSPWQSPYVERLIANHVAVQYVASA